MRLVFLGTPPDAVPPLEALVEAGHEIAFVVTQPDRRRSRGKGSDPSPVRRAADERGLKVLTPVKAREVVDEVRASRARLGVVVRDVTPDSSAARAGLKPEADIITAVNGTPVNTPQMFSPLGSRVEVCEKPATMPRSLTG